MVNEVKTTNEQGEKVVGVLGGMGPEATIDFMRRILAATPAEDDRDHIRMLIDHNPKVPSRIEALVEGTGPSPAPVLQQMARSLESRGADFLAMPCNTAHHYLPEIEEAVHIPILNMIALTAEQVVAQHPKSRQVGLFASTAVFKTGLYESAFDVRGINLGGPGGSGQEDVMEIIRAVKRKQHGREHHTRLNSLAAEMAGRGYDTFVIGCTELSIILNREEFPFPVFDASEVLAREVVRRCQGE